MALDLRDCEFFGPALPEPFVKFDLEQQLNRANLLAKDTGVEGRQLQERWEIYRRKLRELVGAGGDRRVYNNVLEPLVEQLGYARSTKQSLVSTREGMEDGGWLFESEEGEPRLRVWSVGLDTDIDAPSRRGRAYRFSWSRIVQRVLLAKGERAGLLTNGEELRLLICDPARPDSHVTIRLDRVGGWRARRTVPDSYRLVLALASPAGISKIADLTEAARLAQTKVTKELRSQARAAIEGFIQELIDNPRNCTALAAYGNKQTLAEQLWQEGLILVYRLLFIFKLESSADPARAFSFATVALWRQTYSPNQALGAFVRDHLDKGYDTGRILEDGLRTVFRLFQDGLRSRELVIKPLGGMLFGKDVTPLLDRLSWGERATATLLDRLLWTIPRGRQERERVHYGPLDVEDLGRVYEALIELEPGITNEPMFRLRRAKLEVVLPAAQANPYHPAALCAASELYDREADEDSGDAEEADGRGKKTKVQWVEEIPAGRFYLHVGLGRKASGSYYTPHPFVRFLVQETLGPQVEGRSPKQDPKPSELLKLKILDPAMGSGHFLVEACRYLGEALYEACRLCDELASAAERDAEDVADVAERSRLLQKAADLRQRVASLPDPDDELVAYLPSRAVEGGESGLSQAKAMALCRRLVAVHCLYGVDKNQLAVELAKLSLWLESFAEGLPLTFLDHRLIRGDSITGPFFEHLLTRPLSGQPLDNLFTQGLTDQLRLVLAEALVHVRDLEASVGKDVADLEHKQAAKAKLDAALKPLAILAKAWSGTVMLGQQAGDEAFELAAQAVSLGKPLPRSVEMLVEVAPDALAYDLVFPEVFYPDANAKRVGGFDAVLGNPPWDKLRAERRDFVAQVDPRYFVGKEAAGVGEEHDEINRIFELNPLARQYEERIRQTKLAATSIVCKNSDTAPCLRGISDPDLYRFFLLRSRSFLDRDGALGFVLGGGIAKVPSDTSLRRWLFDSFLVTNFLHFVNLKQLFAGASSRIAFVIVTSACRNADAQVRLGYGLQDYDVLFQETHNTKSFKVYEVSARLRVDGDLTKLTTDTAPLTATATRNARSSIRALGIIVCADLHRSNDKNALIDLSDVDDMSHVTDARTPDIMIKLNDRGIAPFYSGRSMDQYDPLPIQKSGKWIPQVNQLVNLYHPKASHLVDRLRYYRFCWRATCGHVSTNERSARACLLPCGAVAGDSLRTEAAPHNRPNARALLALGIFNSFAFDSQARRVVQSNLNRGVLGMLSWPCIAHAAERMVAHSSLRLVSVHEGFAALWREQLGPIWRESRPEFTWPALEIREARWVLRAAIDAVVASAYGLIRADYERVLASFKHRSFPWAPELCLGMFDELDSIGLEAFANKHDPYWDVPLVTTLPKPVINIPSVDDETLSRQPTIDRSGQIRLLPDDDSPLFQQGRAAASSPSRPDNGDLDQETYELIELLLEEKGAIASSDAQDLTGLDAATVRPYLQQLVEEGKARVEGQRRGTRYHRLAYGKA